MTSTVRSGALAACLLFAALGGVAEAQEREPPVLTGAPEGVRFAVSPPWSSDPRDPGFELPESGRSLFDHLIARAPDGRVPYPLSALVAHIEAHTEPHRYFDSPVIRLLVPRGRSLQREAAAPDYFHFPRAILAVDAEPRADAEDAGLLLRHRLYIGYMEATDVLEIVSYNEAAGRFEFQLVRDYRPDGQREVVYANRTLCTACHQNTAPIFARPLWDETNANPAISGPLGTRERDYYGFPLSVGVDLAYVYDNATDQANLYSTLQRIWSESCGEGDSGIRCRAAMLHAVVRYALSGDRGIARDEVYQDDFLAAFRQGWYEAFPKGLAVPDGDLPNRTPDPASVEAVPVSGPIDPLRLRPPGATWRLDDDGHDVAARTISGLADFLAAADVKTIGDALSDSAASRELAGSCQVRRSQARADRLRLACLGYFELTARLSVDGEEVTGSVGRLAFGDDVFLDLDLAGTVVGAAAGRQIELELTTGLANRRPRTLTGDGIVGLSAGWAAGGEAADSTLTLDAGAARLAAAMAVLEDRSARGESDALSERPFRRAEIMSELENALALPPRRWCCADDPALPPARTDLYREVEAAAGTTGVPDISLSLFFSYCGSCHRTHDAFPPNFLAGDIAEVRRRLGHCSERLYYRLAMWREAAGDGPRSPMPPHQFIYRTGLDPEEWVGSEHYGRLRGWIEQTLADERGEAFQAESLLDEDYGTLRTCLPNGETGERVAVRSH